jgi:TP901-1 family phage major tail protein
MPTTGVLNATAVKFQAADTGGTLADFNKIKDSSISISTSARDVTTKDSTGWEEVIAGIKSATISITGLLQLDADWGFNDLAAAQLAGTLVDVEVTVGQGGTGDYTINATCLIESLDLPSAYEDNIEYSVSLKVSGALTYTQNA